MGAQVHDCSPHLEVVRNHFVEAMCPLLIAALLVSAAAQTCTDTKHENSACNGDAYKVVPGATTADACCAACAADATCVQWSHSGWSSQLLCHAMGKYCPCVSSSSSSTPSSKGGATCGQKSTPAPTPGNTTAGKKHWAVIVAGSSGYDNYRHQADACHAYQIMKARGIPESNIILMAVDDVANDDRNPFPGKLFNKPTADGVPGKDVYAGCKIDYKGSAVTPENFVKVLTGTGSGKVLKSTSEDNVFVNFVDHGGVGLIGFPRTTMHKDELQGALKTMKSKDMFKRLVFYLEACESGSMFEGLGVPGVYGLTAANAHESSWGTYCMPNDKVNGKHIGSCLGDTFSVKWMEDLDLETATLETLEKQYTVVKSETTRSHVMQYGDTSFTNEVVGDFVGKDSGLGATSSAASLQNAEASVSVRELHLHNLFQAYHLASTSAERLAAGKALEAQLAEQQVVEATFRRIVELSYPGDEDRQKTVRRLQERPTNMECEKGTHLALRKSCAGKFDAGSGFAMQFQQVVVNICADVQRGLRLDLPAMAAKACGHEGALVV